MKKIMLACALLFVIVCSNAQNASGSEKKKVPPPPPPPPTVTVTHFEPPVIVKNNEKGYAITVFVEKGDSIISVTDNNGTERIKMKEWREKQEYYENKYGKLPPPPPPAPVPPPPPKDVKSSV